jgi:hypothetical protein
MPAFLRLLAGLVLVVLLSALAAAPGRAESSKVYAPGGVALSGYDPVTYFTEGRPRRGSPNHALMWHGATWYFSSPDTLTRFEMNPQAYAPQFGGYCAYAVAEGRVMSSAPDAFFIHEGKLYLLHNAGMVRDLAGKVPDIVARAQAHWPAALSR